MANRVYGYQGYNKGYQYETSPRKLQPEFEPDEQKKKQKKVNKSQSTKKASKSQQQKHKASKADIKKKTTFVAYILFGFAILFTISYRNSIINEKFNEKENLKAELTEIQKENEQLMVSVENELNLTSIEKIAKETLGMNKLNNNQKIYVNLPKKEYVETTAGKITVRESQSWYQKAIDKVKDIF